MSVILAASESICSWLVALLPYQAMTLQAAFVHLPKLISDRLLRQHKSLVIYNKIEKALVITKQIFNYHNANFLLELTSNVEKVTNKHIFQMPSLAQLSQKMHSIVGYDSQRRIHQCCLQKLIRWRYHTDKVTQSSSVLFFHSDISFSSVTLDMVRL